MNIRKKTPIVLVAALAAIAGLRCSGELTDNAAPVELVVTNTQLISQIDLSPTAPGCTSSIGTINMQVIAKNASATGSLVAVRVTRYRVSYRRTDGGTMVPAPFVRAIDTLIGAGETSGLSNFLIVEGDALTQAPFAALLPQNGSRDPETGLSTVKMEVVVEVFGETLGGDNVADATRFPLDFCYDCGGCG